MSPVSALWVGPLGRRGSRLLFLLLRIDSPVHCLSLTTPPDSRGVALFRTPMQGFLTPAEEDSSIDLHQSAGEAAVPKGCESCSGQGPRASLALGLRGQVPALSLPVSFLSSAMPTACLLPSSMLGSVPCPLLRVCGLLFAFELLPQPRLVPVSASKCFVCSLHDKHGQCSHPHQIVQETEPKG